MNNDLISRSALIKDLMDEIPLAENVHIFREIIENQPTAYDVDKVVEQLEKKVLESTECKFEADAQMCGTSASRYSGEIHAYSKTIEIVKAGGINE